MTAVAQAAMTVSEHLSVAFMSRTLGEEPALRLKVGRPDGPSSEGGKRARLSLSLVPTHEPQGPGVMIGWVDVAQSASQVRAYAVAAEQWRGRFGSAFPCTQPQYDDFLQSLAEVVRERGLVVHVSESIPAPRPDFEARPVTGDAGPPLWAWAAGLVGGAATAALVIRFLL